MTNKAAVNYAWGRMLQLWFSAALFLGGVFAISVFGPPIEAVIAPVLTDQVATASRVGDKVTFEIDLTRHRSGCQYAGSEWAVHHGDRVGHLTVFNSEGRPTGSTGITLKPGRTIVGPFRATLPEAFTNAETIAGAVTYQCHPFWDVTQTLGPVSVPPSPE
ncbi:MAG TPA: hypothetical protein VM487_26350 [Phycisphaerae bacterium]|nr:hypothetical protein [Phycisphaerae bacterium]